MTATGMVRLVRDPEVRGSLRSHLQTKLGDSSHILVPEVDINWAVPARMDILLVSNRISGFEIKSDHDSLRRLNRQVEAYSFVVERACLVVGRRHLSRALPELPAWWAVWEASWQGSAIRLRQVRSGRLNPELNLLAVTSFLDREQVTATLGGMGCRGLSRLSVHELRAQLVRALPRRTILSLVRASMIARPDWRRRSLSFAAGGADVV